MNFLVIGGVGHLGSARARGGPRPEVREMRESLITAKEALGGAMNLLEGNRREKLPEEELRSPNSLSRCPV